LNLFGKPSNGHKTGLVNIHLFEKVRWAGMGGAYHISTSQTAQAYLKAPKILAIEFSPALKIKAGVKYHLDMKFIDFVCVSLILITRLFCDTTNFCRNLLLNENQHTLYYICYFLQGHDGRFNGKNVWEFLEVYSSSCER